MGYGSVISFKVVSCLTEAQLQHVTHATFSDLSHDHSHLE